jgi:outer membrane protein assembly factor BamB
MRPPLCTAPAPLDRDPARAAAPRPHGPRARRLRRALGGTALALTLLGVGAAPATAREPGAPPDRFPERIALPDGFQPEGIARQGHTLFAGSLADGDIVRADLVTGETSRLVDAPAGRAALGMAVGRGDRLFVAGGPQGTAYVYDTRTGRPLADYTLGPAGAAFVNDVDLAPDAAWFTDTFRPVLYRLPLDRHGGLPAAADVETVALQGPAADDLLPGQFNLNGIVVADHGRALVVVNTVRGTLYRVDPATGASVRIELGGATVPNGDGLVLRGRTLYVVQNTLNQIAVVALDRSLTTGRVDGVITSDLFRVPTTAVAFGPWLYAVNARFDVAPPGSPPADPPLDYDIVRVRACPDGPDDPEAA